MPEKILKPRFLDRIMKRVSFASREFRINDGFILVEKNATATSTVERNPFTGEPVAPLKANRNTNLRDTVETVFSAEYMIISDIDLRKWAAGIYPAGACIVTINCEELDKKAITRERLESAIGIKVTDTTSTDQVGSPVTVRNGFYKIQKVTPRYLKNRLMEIQVQVELSDNDA